MGKRFYGLRGTQLNIAIAVVAGVDFALFGYDLVCICHSPFLDTTNMSVGCYGYDGGWPEAMSHVASNY